jgi:hypothetical protein
VLQLPGCDWWITVSIYFIAEMFSVRYQIGKYQVGSDQEDVEIR